MKKKEPEGVETASSLFPGTDPDRIASWLEAEGYEVLFRREGWSECLIAKDAERWFGRGKKDADAFLDALRSMFPSAAARSLVERAVELPARDSSPAGESAAFEKYGAAPETPASGKSGEGSGIPPPREPAPGPEPARTASVESESAAEPGSPVLPAVPGIDSGATREEGGIPAEAGTPAPGEKRPSAVEEALPAEAGTPAPGEKRPSAVEEALPAEAGTPEAPPPPAVPKRFRPGQPVSRCLEALDDLLLSIEEFEPELALLAPERQRLQLQFWTCEARSFEEIHSGDPALKSKVREIVQRLTGTAKLFWPGSVRSMQRGSDPSVVMKDHGLDGKSPATWFEASERILEELEAAEEGEAGAAPGPDEHGWWDEDALNPLPYKPASLLEELKNSLEKKAGSVEVPFSWTRAPLKKRPGTKEVTDLALLAKKARWLRLAVPEHVLKWGMVMGRLRCIASRWPKNLAEPLLKVLDPEYRPKKNWAAELGVDPEKRAGQRKKKELLIRAPDLAETPMEETAAWLGEAIPLFDNPRLAKVLYEVREKVAAVDPSRFRDRNRRRRLMALQKKMAEEEPGEGLTLKEAAASLLAASGESAALMEETDLRDERELLDELAGKVRAHTAGAKALLVTNRPDEDLVRNLKEIFAFSELELLLSDPGRVRSKMTAVKNGSYRFVLAAVGFLSHSIDGAIVKACRGTETKLVRVGKGRPRTAVHAFARSLGICEWKGTLVQSGAP